MLLTKTDLFYDTNSDFFFMQVKPPSHVIIHLYIIILNTRKMPGTCSLPKLHYIGVQPPSMLLIGSRWSGYMNKLSKSADKWKQTWRERLINSDGLMVLPPFCGKRNVSRTVLAALWRYVISRTHKTEVYLGIEGTEMLPATNGHAYTGCSLITDPSWPQDSKERSASRWVHSQLRISLKQWRPWSKAVQSMTTVTCCHCIGCSWGFGNFIPIYLINLMRPEGGVRLASQKSVLEAEFHVKNIMKPNH